MNTNQLIKLLLKDNYTKKIFCGVIPIDQIPIRKVRRPCSFIVNTHISTLPGEHWFAIYLPKFGKIQYFDSYGLQPTNNWILNFIKANGSKFIYNSKLIQAEKSTNCGKFCIFYIYMRSRGYKMKKLLQFFVNNAKLNDYFIEKLFKKIKI